MAPGNQATVVGLWEGHKKLKTSLFIGHRANGKRASDSWQGYFNWDKMIQSNYFISLFIYFIFHLLNLIKIRKEKRNGPQNWKCESEIE